MKTLAINLIRMDHLPGMEVDPTIVAEFAEWIKGGCIGRLSPRAWFADFTRVSEEIKARIESDCRAALAIPLIDRHEKHGWIFHSLMLPGGGFLKKKSAEWFKHLLPTEKNTEAAVSRRLKSTGACPRNQVRCAAGVADIVTKDTVYEVEQTLSRQSIFEAVGQALLYRHAIELQTGVRLKAGIAGNAPKESAALLNIVRSMGLEVLEC